MRSAWWSTTPLLPTAASFPRLLEEPYMPSRVHEESTPGSVLGDRAAGARRRDGLQQVQTWPLIRHAYTHLEQGAGVAARCSSIAQQTDGHCSSAREAATWAVRFYERRGFRCIDDEKARLLRRYWTVPERQIAESVVLRRTQCARVANPSRRPVRMPYWRSAYQYVALLIAITGCQAKLGHRGDFGHGEVGAHLHDGSTLPRLTR